MQVVATHQCLVFGQISREINGRVKVEKGSRTPDPVVAWSNIKSIDYFGFGSGTCFGINVFLTSNTAVSNFCVAFA
ncbi:hypothetical protein P3342_002497 [Pyrenophora teres f. teres]|nr:hypothetical protein P3342_002497 [Pyrenophora teres f. teres]